MARGGKLYDKWFKVIGADKPKTTHKAWPASNTKKKGNVTWRCKSCHGWDGLGKDGAYAKGSYKTGIKGVNAYWGADPEKIIAVMKDDTHGLGGMMEDEDFQDVALFVSKGMVDMRGYIDYATKSPKAGDQARGADYFNTICAGCHREDGKRPKDMDKPLGAQMGNPWEVMHKILNGHPGAPMPALRALPNKEQIIMDLMAHVKTLPKKK
jgi:thiosulfate dehydrogenase